MVSFPNCIPVPNPERLRSVHLNYNGRGTQANDVVLVVGLIGFIALAIILTTLVYWHYRTKRRQQ
jgi:hypothetical protein